MKKLVYEKPVITDEREFETQALACNKTPGRGSAVSCGPVWASPHGNQISCYMNPNSRSS